MKVIDTTRPTPEGEMLWRVSFSGSYWDNDPRMPGRSEVGKVVFVLARSLDEALAKAEPHFKQARKDNESSDAKVEAHIATIETLVPTEEQASGSGIFRDRLRKVALSDPEDAKRYRLAVCLVPVEDESVPSS